MPQQDAELDSREGNLEADPVRARDRTPGAEGNDREPRLAGAARQARMFQGFIRILIFRSGRKSAAEG